MSVHEDPYLSTYLRQPRIPDTVVVPGLGDQSKTLLLPRRRPRVPKHLEAGPFQGEVGSFALHMAAEGKAPRTIRNYTEAVRWFAAAYVLRETEKRRWEEVDEGDLRRWTVRLLGEYSTAYAGNQFRSVRRFLRCLGQDADGGEPAHRLGVVPDRPWGLALGGHVQRERADLGLQRSRVPVLRNPRAPPRRKQSFTLIPRIQDHGRVRNTGFTQVRGQVRIGLNSHLQIPLYLQSVQARGLPRPQRLGGQGQDRTVDLPLFSWPQKPRSAVAPAPRTRRCHTSARARPRLSTPTIFHPDADSRPKTGCRRLPAGLPAIPLPPGQAGNDPP